MRRKSFVRLLIAASFLFIAALGSAQYGKAPVQVVITPDHADWKYAPGEKALST